MKDSVFVAACIDYTKRRKFCYENSTEEKGGEDCLVEELEEKRCVAQHLCPVEAKHFYQNYVIPNLHSEYESSNSKGVCALWAEAFAFTRNNSRVDVGTAELHRLGKQYVDSDRDRARECRGLVVALAKCMHQQQG